MATPAIEGNNKPWNNKGWNRRWVRWPPRPFFPPAMFFGPLVGRPPKEANEEKHRKRGTTKVGTGWNRLEQVGTGWNRLEQALGSMATPAIEGNNKGWNNKPWNNKPWNNKGWNNKPSMARGPLPQV
ncbi:hypothetical protein, partial [Aeromicrobium sp.]|uniref:hypothetical protein n=1 Tax=Aeromicrobium sp. TaxID=1871063 RepID=UPI00403470B7